MTSLPHTQPSLSKEKKTPNNKEGKWRNPLCTCNTRKGHYFGDVCDRLRVYSSLWREESSCRIKHGRSWCRLSSKIPFFTVSANLCVAFFKLWWLVKISNECSRLDFFAITSLGNELPWAMLEFGYISNWKHPFFSTLSGDLSRASHQKLKKIYN